MNLNRRALRHCQALIDDAARYRIICIQEGQGPRIVDCGVRADGGLAAGVQMAEICLAALGQVRIEPGDPAVWSGPWISVTTDHPLSACIASQYAGWRLAEEGFFAMGSGPMRAAAAREPLFRRYHCRERAGAVLGVLECAELPPLPVCRTVAERCDVPLSAVTLLVAPTASLAGTIQVVARSVESALHKLMHLGFDLERVVAGWGSAPLPPVAEDDRIAVGRTNDAVLYGARVTLWIRGDDPSLESLGPKVPSNASGDFGRPFEEILSAHGNDFYQLDPMLFGPACVELVNVDTGRMFQYGRLMPEVLQGSFSK